MKKLLFGAAMCLLLPAAAFADFSESGFAGIASTDNAGTGLTSSSVVVTTDETITDLSVVLNGAIHDWVGDLQITLSNGTSEIIIMGLQDGLSFDGTIGQAGTMGAGGFGSSGHLSGDPDDAPVALDYTFATGGADFDAGAEAADGGGLIDETVIYAPTAENAVDADTGTVLSFASVFGGQSTAATWTFNVADTFATGDDGSFAGFTINFQTAAVPEPTSLAVLGIAGLGLVVRRRRS